MIGKSSGGVGKKA